MSHVRYPSKSNYGTENEYLAAVEDMERAESAHIDECVERDKAERHS